MIRDCLTEHCRHLRRCLLVGHRALPDNDGLDLLRRPYRAHSSRGLRLLEDRSRAEDRHVERIGHRKRSQGTHAVLYRDGAHDDLLRRLDWLPVGRSVSGAFRHADVGRAMRAPSTWPLPLGSSPPRSSPPLGPGSCRACIGASSAGRQPSTFGRSPRPCSGAVKIPAAKVLASFAIYDAVGAPTDHGTFEAWGLFCTRPSPGPRGAGEVRTPRVALIGQVIGFGVSSWIRTWPFGLPDPEDLAARACCARPRVPSEAKRQASSIQKARPPYLPNGVRTVHPPKAGTLSTGAGAAAHFTRSR